MARLLDTSGTLAAIGSEDIEIASRKSALFRAIWRKMKKLLDSTQTEGDPFDWRWVDIKLVVKDWAGEVKVQIQAPDLRPCLGPTWRGC